MRLETLLLTAVAVGIGIATVAPMATYAGGRFVETDGPVALVSRTDAREWRVSGAPSVATPPVSPPRSVRSLLARRVLAFMTMIPLDWESYGLDAHELEAYERYREPVLQAATETALGLFPSIAAFALYAIEHPDETIAALNPIGIARAVIAGNYEDFVDWKTVLTEENDNDSAQAMARVVSGMVASRLLVVGNRSRGVGIRKRILRPSLAVRSIRLDAPSPGRLLVYQSRGRITGTAHIRKGQSSLGFKLAQQTGERERVALLRDAVWRSDRMGFGGRLRVTPTPGSERFLARHGLVPMFDDLPSDYVLSRRSAIALLGGQPLRSGKLDEWTRLGEWETARIRQYSPELFDDLETLIAPTGTTDFIVEIRRRYQGAFVLPNERRVLLPAEMAPDDRLLALANEVGQRKFRAEVAPPEGWTFFDPDALRRVDFVSASVENETKMRGAGILYELAKREEISKRIGRELPSRYVEPFYNELFQALRHNEPEARRFLGMTWSVMNRIGGETYHNVWRRRYEEVWDQTFRRTAMDEVQRMLRPTD